MRGLWSIVLLMAAAGTAVAQDRPPVIQHQPVTIAVRDQPLIVRARVIDDRGAVKAVTLFYATSPDAAPFELAMESSGGGVYIAAIPGHLLAGIETLSYYIEATDDQDNAAETPWHAVRIRAPDAVPAGADGRAAPKWVAPALVAGGAAIVVGGALYAANRDSGSSAPPAPDLAGVYSGGVTVIIQDPEAPPDVSNRTASVTITADGTVTSDSLHAGTTLTGRLSGSNFTLTADVVEEGVTGQISYRGTIVDGRILGTIEGARTTAAGAGTYSGSFTLQRP